MDQKGYHFYEMDEKTNESKQLLETAWEPAAAEVRGNPTAGLIAAGLAALLLLVSAILAWVIFHKNRSQIILTHAIMSTLALLFGAVAVVWALGVRSSAANHRAPSSGMSFIALLGSVIFGIYHAIAALFIWVAVNFHLHYMESVKARPDDWSFHFWDYDFAYAQLEDWRIFLTLAVFAVIIAILFALVAFTAWTNVSDPVEVNKILLGLGLIAVAVFGFLTVIWQQDYRIIFNTFNSKLDSSNLRLHFIIFVLACIALGLAFLNSIFSLLRWKSVNFVSGVLFAALFIILAVFVAFAFRDVVSFSNKKPYAIDTVAQLAHQDDYIDACVSKYVDAGAANAGSIGYRWEESPVVSKSLNTNCNPVVNDVLIWHYYVFAIFAAFLLASIGVVIVSNFALSSGVKDDEAFGRLHLMDIVAFVVIVLLGIALGFWLGFRPNPEPVARYTDANSVFALDSQGRIIPNQSFKHLSAVLGKHFANLLAGLFAKTSKI